MIDPWIYIHDKMNASVEVILLYVFQSEGSSPGRQGFTMAVGADNSFCGSIGGGIMEHKFVEMAKARLASGDVVSEVYKQVHDKIKAQNQSGMICSGEQSIFFYQLRPSDKAAITQLAASLQQFKNGTLTISNDGIAFNDAVPLKNYNCVQKNPDDFVMVEKSGFKNQLHIIGGGHCALALSQIMSMQDFYIRLYETREGLSTVVANNFVHERIILDDYSELAAQVPEGDNIYVPVMTFGYRTDDIAFRAIMHKKVKYIGILGSLKKIEKLFDSYRQEKMEEHLLKVIHTPIGLPIKSETPAEIAISIAAEIIAVKNKT